MTRLRPPARQVPPLVAERSHGGSGGGNKSKIQLLLIVVMVVCVGMTVYFNVTSTSSSIMAVHNYGAAVNRAIEDFKQGTFTTTTTRTKNDIIATTNTNTNSKNVDPPPPQQQQPEHHENEPQRREEEEEEDKQEEPQSNNLAAAEAATFVAPKSQIASLSCDKHGGPSDEFAQEMVYWSDVPSDSLYVSPLKHKLGARRQYMTFEPDGGGWNNIRMAMETVVGLAVAMGRTLVLPPQKQMYLLGKGDNQQRRHFGFEDFFPMEQMAAENAALEMITMKEFLETEAMTGQLKDRNTGKVSFPPHNRTDWNGLTGEEYDELREWLRNVALVPQWNPDACLATFPAKGDHKSIEELRQMQQTIHSQGGNPDAFIGHPVPVDGPAIDRMKENLKGRQELCVYDEAMQQEMVVHFVCAHKLRLRLLVHFYGFIFMEDWKEDLWLKRFMRDHMRYNDNIQCAAARIVHAMRKLAQEHDPNGNPDGIFDTFHIRRGDFQYQDTRISAEEIIANTQEELKPNSTIFIATDEQSKSFFEPFRKNYHIYFLDDFKEALKGVNTNYYGMIDQLVASRGRTYFGCWFSTFTSYINRMRGYRSVKDKLPGYEQGILPTSYYYVPMSRKTALHEYVPLSGSFFAREFPTSWRDIDKGIGELDSTVQ